MGHVPPRPLPEAGQSAHVPGRQRRRTRGDGGPLAAAVARRRLSRLGEDIAARFLAGRGAEIVARNVRQGRGEIDLVVSLGGERIAVEVKTRRRGPGHPLDNFTPAKAARVRQTALRLDPPAYRVDLVMVTVDVHGADVHWVPYA